MGNKVGWNLNDHKQAIPKTKFARIGLIFSLVLNQLLN